MEIPYCVVDAITLIDYIHEIKKWVYEGCIRLVVPISTIERIEILCQKSTDKKPKPQEPLRPKSSGKFARKEYPTFDINPRIAKEFLARLQSENIGFDVEFQEKAHLYTPWVGIEEQEAKRPEPTEDRPTTFAQALAKMNVKAGSGIVEAAKGPAKPKLVSRAPGNDVSPWKTAKKVPEISAREAPVVMRPLLSYMLWRLHENTTARSDTSSLILLSSHAETRNVAQKFKITPKTVDEIRCTIAAQRMTPVDRNTWGELEQEFGVQEVRPKPVENGDAHLNGNIARQNGDEIPQSNGKIVSNEELEVEKLVKQVQGTKEIEEAAIDPKVNGEHTMKHDQDSDPSHKTFNEVSLPNIDFQANFNGVSCGHYPSVIDIEPDTTIGINGSAEPANGISERVASRKIDGISAWINGLAAKANGFHPTYSDHDHESKASTTREITPPQQDFPKIDHPVIYKRPINPTTPSPRPSPIVSPARTEPIQEPEDSDEEVVVFNPKAKRLSAQQKPPIPSPKKATPARHPPRRTTPVAPAFAPAIIDPDAFGRSFATNPRPNMQTYRPRQSPRGSPRSATRVEPEEGYILKSGMPRGAARGKGKLWIP